MCIKCVRYNKRYPARSKTYGQIKATAQSICRGPFGIWRIPNERRAAVGIEAHIYKIEQARTKRRYKRNRRVMNDND